MIQRQPRDIFPENQMIMGESGKFDAGKLADVEDFMRDPTGWSKDHGRPGAGGERVRSRRCRGCPGSRCH
jgi:hypothetical protein